MTEQDVKEARDLLHTCDQPCCFPEGTPVYVDGEWRSIEAPPKVQRKRTAIQDT
jgi:hypothetical protein